MQQEHGFLDHVPTPYNRLVARLKKIVDWREGVDGKVCTTLFFYKDLANCILKKWLTGVFSHENALVSWEIGYLKSREIAIAGGERERGDRLIDSPQK